MVILKKIALPVIHLYFKASKKVRIEPKSDGMKYHLLNYVSGTSGRCQWAFCKMVVCGQITLRNSLNTLCHLHISLVKALKSPAVGKLVSLWHFSSSLTAESFYWGSQYAAESSLGVGKLQLVDPVLVLVNKGLMEHSHLRSFTCCLGLLSGYGGRVERWWQSLYDPQNLKYVVSGPLRKCLLSFLWNLHS